MLKTLKSILTVAVGLSLLTTSAFAGAIDDWAKGEFSLSTLSEKDRIKELKWFQKAAKPFKGMEINVLSETIPTHTYESKTLTKAFEEREDGIPGEQGRKFSTEKAGMHTPRCWSEERPSRI